MTTATLTEADIRTRDNVLRQLDWDPEVDASAIGVSAKAGVVALTGYIDTYAGKLAAERAAKRVRGVRAVANDIDVRPKLGRTDVDIATDVARALELWGNVPDTVQAVVHGGYVTLTGRVGWLYQRRTAEKAIRHVRGVRGILNHIEADHGTVARDVQHRITAAIHRDADIDARHIDVTVVGNVATLVGRVATWSQRDAAERAAANAPGIRAVDNRLEIAATEGADEIC
jgi:osmotically-inducible protein OsmY